MAVHKVPLDVEADDKFLGPLSFKQFLFFGGALISGYLTFLMISKGVWPISIIFLLPALGFATLAFPWSKEQPSELFLASRIRFLIKPRKRIWDQSGIKELVKVTAPVRQVHNMTDGLNQTEVRSRFNALASMIDSRGWAVKNVSAPSAEDQSDRLVSPTAEEDSPFTEILNETTDVMDVDTSTIAKQFDHMIQQSSQSHKSAALNLVNQARQSSAQTTQQPAQNQPQSSTTNNNQDFWFMNTPAQPTDPSLAVFQQSQVVAPGAATPITTQSPAVQAQPAMTEEELLEVAHEKHRRDALQSGSSHGAVLSPTGLAPATPSPAVKPPEIPQNKPIITPKDPGILELAQSNDLNIETLARQSHKKDDDEVVISLR